jgi:subfamily B ATP-binding cassette protein MsbA
MIEFIKQYAPYYKNYKKQFFYTIIGIILVAIGTSGTAYVIKPLLDEIFINKNEFMLSIIPFLVIALYAAKGFGRYIQAYYISYIGGDIIRIIRDNLLSHILRLDLAFFNARHGGELISRITNDINRIQGAVSNQIAKIIQESLTIVSLIFVVIYQSPELAFYGLVVLPLVVYPLSKLAKKMKKLSFLSQEKNSDITSNLSETFNNIEIIKANGTEDFETDKFKQHNLESFNINIKAVKTNELVSPIMEILGAIAVAIVITVGGHQVINGEMTVGTFFSFMTALFMLYTPVKSLSSLYNKLQDAIAANERINDLFSKFPDIKSGEKELSTSIETIEFQNIQLHFGDKIALNGINLKGKKGETIALVGDSGGGKSSLINTLIRFYDTTDGAILIDNENIKNIDLQSLRKSISIVTQRVYIFNDTVRENICYGQDYDEERLLQAIKDAHAYDFIQNLPNGLDTILDEFGTNLSGGQRQRIAIARAIYKNPQILIFDEATSALDNESESLITEVLHEISKDKITFIIAHRLSTIKNATKIAVFQNGKIVCEGKEEALLLECKEYQRLHNLANI